MRCFYFFLLILVASSCASRLEPSAIYRKSLLDNKTPSKSNRTVLIFLVDGLPVNTLRSQLALGKLPRIKDYFVGSKNQFYNARAGFPSITYPSVASLLTERPLDQHSIYGNKIFHKDEFHNFESPSNFSDLDRLTRGQTIFKRLSDQGFRSVSLSFTFNQEADAHIENLDLKSALSVKNQDYSYIDTKLIDSLEILLSDAPPHLWPDFIYIHLVGVDFLSHDYGPNSKKVTLYLQSLDKKLQQVFKILQKIENKKQRKIVALMTADHGYDKQITHIIDIKSVLPQNTDSEELRVLNESRYINFRFPQKWTRDQKMHYAKSLVKNPFMDIVAFRDQQTVQVVSKELQTPIYYGKRTCAESSFSISIGVDMIKKVCPQQVPFAQNQLYYPYFVTNISQYFQSVDHPDVVVIPKPGVSFNAFERGQHGGPTPDEIYVPLLIRGASLPASSEVIPLSDLLKFL